MDLNDTRPFKGDHTNEFAGRAYEENFVFGADPQDLFKTLEVDSAVFDC